MSESVCHLTAPSSELDVCDKPENSQNRDCSFVRGKLTLLTERLEDFLNGEVALSTNVLVRGGVLWSKIVFCCFVGDVCVCGETNAVTADVCAQNLFRADVLGPCMARVESVLMSCSTTVLLSSQSAFETVTLLFPPSFGFVGRPPFVWLKTWAHTEH